MFNAEIPSRVDLPSTAQLVKSTIIAVIAAAVILVTIVLPAEYSIDPTGIGRALQLTQMGEIKKQLAIEAEADRQRDRQQAPATTAPDRRSSLPGLLAGLLVSSAAAHPQYESDEDVTSDGTPPGPLAQAAPAGKTDEVVFTLKPNEGIEYKMTMLRGGAVRFSWSVDGGKVNYDMHGTPKGGGKETSYKKGSQVTSDAGTLTAAYDGSHGWFWRNRGSADVTIKLKVSGAYSEIKRVN
ncbi:MAG: transmembrane anchor protein [Reyranella sp.]|nr:transmembrane anchor protein [Reyranella sp.]